MNNGNCSQICINEIPGHQCSCRDGYTLLDDGHQCVGMLISIMVLACKFPLISFLGACSVVLITCSVTLTIQCTHTVNKSDKEEMCY